MSVGEIYNVISEYSFEVIFRFVKKMLKDQELGVVSLPSSIEEIEKVCGICKTIDNSSKRRYKVSASQEYWIKMVFAAGIVCYYDVENINDIEKVYIEIQKIV